MHCLFTLPDDDAWAETAMRWVASVKVVEKFVLGEAVMDQAATAASEWGSASIMVGTSSAIASTCM